MSSYEQIFRQPHEEEALAPLREKIQAIDERLLFTINHLHFVANAMSSVVVVGGIDLEQKSTLFDTLSDQISKVALINDILIESRKDNARHVAWVKYRYGLKELQNQFPDSEEKMLHPVRIQIFRPELEAQKLDELIKHANTSGYLMSGEYIETVFSGIMYESRAEQIDFLRSLGICDEQQSDSNDFVHIWCRQENQA